MYKEAWCTLFRNINLLLFAVLKSLSPVSLVKPSNPIMKGTAPVTKSKYSN